MKVADLLEIRRANWHQLEELCAKMEGLTGTRALTPQMTVRAASLYRAACADLALADAYQLPPNTVAYLHRLVGRAHNQLYRSRGFDARRWVRVLLRDVPQRVFRDRCVQLAFVLFWGIFVLSGFIAYHDDWWPGYAELVSDEDETGFLEQLEHSFSRPVARNSASENAAMAGYYIFHNTGIGLRCFAGGLLILPGLFHTIFNAALLGAAFGYMARPDVYAEEGRNFFNFVTAHGPFELTAIALSAGAGLRLGMAWIITLGMRRSDHLELHAKRALPVMGCAALLFFGAAFIEGFISPSTAPYWLKASVAVVTTCLLIVYFFILGLPWGDSPEEPEGGRHVYQGGGQAQFSGSVPHIAPGARTEN
jgi:uncharacterized membrane protein SpoIIM required for sporulation